jgi:hypothetical protein
MNNFVEAEHPRNKYGKFTTKQLKFVLTAFKRTKEPKHVNERQKIKGLKKDPL